MKDLIPEKWRNLLIDEFEKEYFIDLSQKVDAAYSNSVVYPARDFALLNCVLLKM